MRKVILLIGLSAVLVAGSIGAPALVDAQATKSKIKEGAKKATQQATIKWESLSAEQQQRAINKMKEGAAQLAAWWATLPP